MFKRKNRRRSVKPSMRSARLSFERLEDRSMLHGGITEFSAGITPDSAPTGIVQAPDDHFWFTEFDASRLGRLNITTGTITEFTLPAGRGPLNITVGPDNNLWFTENTGDRIGRINPLAGADAAIQASLMEFIVPGVGSLPNDIVAGPDGALWFTQSGSDQIGRIDTAGVVTNEFAVPGAGSTPAGITSNPDGALWFTEAGSGEIGRITTTGTISEFAIPVPANAISDPEDIVTGPGGNLFFTDFGRDQIGRITPAGLITQFSLAQGRGPHSIAAAPDGNLYFTEATSGRLGRLPAGALAPGRPTSGAPPLEEFDFIARDSVPLGIAVGGETGSEDIFFTLNAGNAIGTFEAHLAQITIAATGPLVDVYDIHLNLVRTITPFPGFQGDVRVAVQELAGTHIVGGASNGVPDVIVGAGPGGGPHVKVFDGSNNSELASFYAFDPKFTGGVSLGADDVNGDGRADIIVSAGTEVKVIDGTKVNQVRFDGQISDTALIANFFAFPAGVVPNVTLAAGDLDRDGKAEVVVGAGPGAGSNVKVIDGARLGELQSNGVISDAALLGNFLAFAPSFRGGVFVGVAINAAQRDVIVGAGAGGGPHVKAVNGAQLGQIQSNGVIANSALLGDFFTTSPTSTRGVFIAADADHRDGPLFGPPGITIDNSRRDINDVFVFRSPSNPANTVLTMTVSPFSTATTPNTFVPGLGYEFRIANRDLTNTTDDLTFRMTFGPADSAGVQDVSLRAMPAARFPGSGGVLVKGFTGQNVPARGVGGTGGQFRAAEQDDPFFFDAAGFNALLNNPNAVQGVLDGEFPRGTSPNGFGPGSTPNFDAPNFFGPSVNTLAMTLEIPSARLIGSVDNAIAVWGRTDNDGVQLDRMGRPALNTALIPPVPRGAGFPIGGSSDQNRQDRRNAFNAGHPSDDRANFLADMVSVLTAFYPAGRPGGVPNAAQATVLANFLLPDILVHDVTSTAGFGGQVVSSGGNAFLGGGRKLSDDIISTELSVLTDDDLPAAFGGGPNLPAIVTQNVRDDNGLNLMDGSLNPPSPRGTNPGAGTLRAAVFPYIGARNPAGLPGTPPPP